MVSPNVSLRIHLSFPKKRIFFYALCFTKVFCLVCHMRIKVLICFSEDLSSQLFNKE